VPDNFSDAPAEVIAMLCHQIDVTPSQFGEYEARIDERERPIAECPIEFSKIVPAHSMNFASPLDPQHVGLRDQTGPQLVVDVAINACGPCAIGELIR